MKRIVLIGSGRVAEVLGTEIFRCPSLCLVQLFARNAERGRQLAERWHCDWTDDPAALAAADLYLLAVSDRAVAALSSRLSFPAESVVAHTAGALPVEALEGSIRHRAVLYPLQTFTQGRRIEPFRTTPFFVEGTTPEALRCVREVGESLSDRVALLDSAGRERLHLAAVFVNNFSNLMYTLGAELAAGAGVPFDALRPLLEETARKALQMDPREAQSGPAVRGDEATCRRHRELLRAHNPELESIYELLSETIWETSKRS